MANGIQYRGPFTCADLGDQFDGVPGVYQVIVRHPTEKGKCIRLKVGQSDNLRRRIRYHCNQHPDNTVLARHIMADPDLGRLFGFAVADRDARKAFMKTWCYFLVYPMPGDEAGIDAQEQWMEQNLSPRYVGRGQTVQPGGYGPFILIACPP